MMVSFITGLLKAQKENNIALYLFICVVVIGSVIIYDWILSIVFSPCLLLFSKNIATLDILKAEIRLKTKRKSGFSHVAISQDRIKK